MKVEQGSLAATPARGTRPRNRKELILAAAAQLFAERGYGAVSMSDVAEAVNVQPSALYRHVGGKQDLLREAILWFTTLRRRAVELDDARGFDGLLEALADSALASRSSTWLWVVEVRNLDLAAQRGLRKDVRALPDAFAARIAELRPELVDWQTELLSWSALDVLASLSFHDLRLPDPELRDLLVGAMRRIVFLDQGDQTLEPGLPPVPASTHSRRERILSTAADLFAERGYAAVTIEEIAVGAEVSGAGVYTYFSGKAQLLEAVVARAVEWLAYVQEEATRTPGGPERRIRLLVDSYLRHASDRSALMSVLLTEVRHLADPARAAADQAGRDSVALWVEALTALDPERREAVARLQVHAARMIAQDFARTPSLRRSDRASKVIESAMLATLNV